MFVVGGKDTSGQPHSEIYASAIAQDGRVAGWSKVGDITNASTGAVFPLAFHGTAVHLGNLYILGGETPGAGFSTLGVSVSLNANCTLGNDWESFTLPNGVGLRRMAVASRWGELYMIGGHTATGYASDAWQTTLDTPAATLTLHKSAQMAGDFAYGELITYTLSYANPWPYPDGQTGVVITDTLPASTTLLSATPGYVLTDTDTLRWDIGALAKDASGAVTFTVEITPAPALDWSLNSAVDYHPALSGTATLLHEAVIIYRIAYTPTGDAATAGVLLTATLPAQLFPLRTEPSVPYAVQGQHVIWRIPGTITQTGYARVAACILQPFSTQELLTYTATLEDVLGQTTLVRVAALQPETEGMVAASCTSETLALAHPTTVPPLYPDLVVRNRAWICSNELGGCQESNETITRYWPVKVFLPLVIRQQ
ncbi:MAG: DUF11 domain-containing protein [Anaerolineae bacterium]|nr:DUF11 domain-containing protein [Anaerolineae bacterium]